MQERVGPLRFDIGKPIHLWLGFEVDAQTVQGVKKWAPVLGLRVWLERRNQS